MKKAFMIIGFSVLVVFALLGGMFLAKVNYENTNKSKILTNQSNSNTTSTLNATTVSTTSNSGAKKEVVSNNTNQSNNSENNIDEIKNSIKILRAYPSEPNSAGGVDLSIVFKNMSSKTIKYVSFEVVPYNAVGDAVECTIRHRPSFGGRVTGPIQPKQVYGEDMAWSCAWYNNTIRTVKVIGVNIIYMDGSTITIDQENMKYILP